MFGASWLFGQLPERSVRSEKDAPHLLLKASPSALVNEIVLAVLLFCSALTPSVFESASVEGTLELIENGIVSGGGVDGEGRRTWSRTKKVLNQKWNIFSLIIITLGLFFRVIRTSPLRMSGGFRVKRSTRPTLLSSTVGVNCTWLSASKTVNTGTNQRKKRDFVNKLCNLMISYHPRQIYNP